MARDGLGSTSGAILRCPLTTEPDNQRMRHSLRLKTIGIAFLTGAVLTTTFADRSAAAQTAPARACDGDLFQAASGPRNFLTLDAPDVLAHKLFSAGLFFDFQRFPYKIDTGRPNAAGTPQTQYPLSTELKSELQLALGLFDRFQVGLGVPVVLAMRGDGGNGDSGLTSDDALSTAGLGDIRVEVKGQILTAGDDDQFALGAVLGGSAPTGKKDAYIGEKRATGRAKVMAQLALGRLRIGGEAGVLLRQTPETFDVTVGNQVLYGLGASVRLLRGFEVLGEVAGRSGITDFTTRCWDENPIEGDLAARLYPRGMVAITGGLGFGLGKGLGAPQSRIFQGAEYPPDFRDADNDGVYDSEARCPDQPEDRDGFKDNDGCPGSD